MVDGHLAVKLRGDRERVRHRRIEGAAVLRVEIDRRGARCGSRWSRALAEAEVRQLEQLTSGE